ncbi:hypothetical protein ALC62_00776, partial [Cyphomyrmex costatus]
VDIPSLLVETFPRFERQRKFASAMVSQNDLHVTRWINVDCNFQKLVASSGQVVSSTHFLSQLSMYSFYREFIYIHYCLYFYDVLSFDDVLFPAFFFNGGGGGGIRGRSVSMCTRSSRSKSRNHVRFSRPLTYTTALAIKIKSPDATPKRKRMEKKDEEEKDAGDFFVTPRTHLFDETLEQITSTPHAPNPTVRVIRRRFRNDVRYARDTRSESFIGEPREITNSYGLAESKVSHNENGMDRVYGAYLDKVGLMLGNKRFDVDDADNIIIGGVRYAGTPGLYELIFKRPIRYTRKKICASTRACCRRRTRISTSTIRRVEYWPVEVVHQFNAMGLRGECGARGKVQGADGYDVTGGEGNPWRGGYDVTGGEGEPSRLIARAAAAPILTVYTYRFSYVMSSSYAASILKFFSFIFILCNK